VHLQQLVRRLRILPVALAILAVGVTQPPATLVTHTDPPLVGFTFIPSQAIDQGYDPGPALSQLVRRLHPDLVRIPVYWDEVAPTAGGFDFSRVDGLLAELAEANARHPTHPARAMLVVGVRNLAWPEVHLPNWVDISDGLDLDRITASRPYLEYLQQSFQHFGANPILYAWQVENEPLDNTNEALGRVAIANGVVADEVALLKSIDSIHRVVITTYNSSNVALDMEATSSISWLFRMLPGPKAVGHPAPTLKLADVLGLDIYVDTPSTPLDEVSVMERIDWKAKALSYWSAQADQSGKEVWITEMQGAPWNGEGGFSKDDLVQSAQLYSGTGVTAVLLWGVESWLNSPDWMVAGQAAIATLRT
jgi:hypothetical protein